MRAVWGYELEVGECRVNMPDTGDVLGVGMKGGKPVLWVEVDTDAPLLDRPFLLAATNEELKEEYVLNYIGSVAIPMKIAEELETIYHVFEVL